MPIQGDTVNEDNETLFVNLTSPNGAKSGCPGSRHDRRQERAAVALDQRHHLGRGQGATFVVTLAGTTLRTVTVGFSTTDGTAKGVGLFGPDRHAVVRTG